MVERIITESKRVMDYLDQVRDLADKNRVPLGFLPESAYREAAIKRHLWIAPADNIGQIRGYLLFGGAYPRLRVFQICVHPDHRLSGAARELIAALKDFGEKFNYQTITARVASELEANNFWQKSGFHIIRTIPGEGNRRSINVYALELDVPSLFHSAQRSISSSYDASSLMGRSIRPLLETPSYVIDLNVFFDVVKKRNHDDEAASIISSALKNEIRLFVRELHRKVTTPVLR